jgi:S1-C subfamily serine protease
VTSVDWAALLVIAFSAFLGWRRGLIGSALSLAGVIVGSMAGARIAPHLLHNGSRSPYTPVAALVGATLGAALLQAGGMLLGAMARRGLRLSPLRAVDSAGGLLLGGAAGVALVWVVGAVALLLPGQPGLRQAAQRSEILSHLDDAVPPRRVLNALARIDPFPSIVTPGAPPARPDPSVRRSGSIAAAAASVVRVTGSACGLGIEGSGWVARAGLVVTAAHVVAGESDTQVETPSGQVLPAPAVAFDPHNDIAVLRVAGLDAQPLPLADATPGTPAALLGFPGNGPLATTPVRVGHTSAVLSEDAYGHGPVTRTITLLSGVVRHGDSGGPVVDRTGRVQGTVFASRLNSASGYSVPSDVVRRDLDRAVGLVSTRDCAG